MWHSSSCLAAARGTFLFLCVQITRILSGPRAHISGPFGKWHFIHNRSRSSWESKDKHNYVVLSISYMTSLIIAASGDGWEGEYGFLLIRLRMQLTHHQVSSPSGHTHTHTHVHKPSCPVRLHILEFSRGKPSSLLLLSTGPSTGSCSRALKACGCRIDSGFCCRREESIKQSIQTIQRWQTDEYHWKGNHSLQSFKCSLLSHKTWYRKILYQLWA